MTGFFCLYLFVADCTSERELLQVVTENNLRKRDDRACY